MTHPCPRGPCVGCDGELPLVGRSTLEQSGYGLDLEALRYERPDCPKQVVVIVQQKKQRGNVC